MGAAGRSGPTRHVRPPDMGAARANRKLYYDFSVFGAKPCVGRPGNRDHSRRYDGLWPEVPRRTRSSWRRRSASSAVSSGASSGDGSARPSRWAAIHHRLHALAQLRFGQLGRQRLVLRRRQRRGQDRVVRRFGKPLQNRRRRQRALAGRAVLDERAKRRAFRGTVLRPGQRNAAGQFRLEQHHLDQFTGQRRAATSGAAGSCAPRRRSARLALTPHRGRVARAAI